MPATTQATYPVVPQQPGTAITLNGRDSKIIVANYKLGGNQLQYSTSEIMTNATIAGRDVAVLYGDQGTDGETVLRYADAADRHRDRRRRRRRRGTRPPATCG